MTCVTDYGSEIALDEIETVGDLIELSSGTFTFIVAGNGTTYNIKPCQRGDAERQRNSLLEAMGGAAAAKMTTVYGADNKW